MVVERFRFRHATQVVKVADRERIAVKRSESVFVGASTSQTSGTTKKTANAPSTTVRTARAVSRRQLGMSNRGRQSRRARHVRRRRLDRIGAPARQVWNLAEPSAIIISSYANPYSRVAPYDVQVQSTDPIAPAESVPQRRANLRWRPARLASLIFEELGHRIIGGALAEGAVLPTEPALCEEFGFSRTVVREGLKLLEGRGLGARRAGARDDRSAAKLMGPPRPRSCCASPSSTTTTCHCSTT